MEIVDLQFRQKTKNMTVAACVCLCVSNDLKCNARASGPTQPRVSSCDQSPRLRRLKDLRRLHECIYSHAVSVCVCMRTGRGCVGLQERSHDENKENRGKIIMADSVGTELIHRILCSFFTTLPSYLCVCVCVFMTFAGSNR